MATMPVNLRIPAPSLSLRSLPAPLRQLRAGERAFDCSSVATPDERAIATMLVNPCFATAASCRGKGFRLLVCGYSSRAGYGYDAGEPPNPCPFPLPSARCLLRYGSFVQGKGLSIGRLWLLLTTAGCGYDAGEPPLRYGSFVQGKGLSTSLLFKDDGRGR
jgi:hypothetical protein